MGSGYHNIAMFDWDGNPLKLMRTDYNIMRLDLDREEDALYAMILDTEGRPYIGRIRL